MLELTATEAWTRILDYARTQLPEQIFRTWLEPTRALSFDAGVITIGTPDRFAAEWNESKHADALTSYAPIVLGHPAQIRFTLDEGQQKRPQMDLFVAPPPTQNSTTAVPQQGSHLSERYTFANFVIGKSNELAAAAAQAVAAAPGKVYNPLFIYGETGLGKTHLMQAVAHEIAAQSATTRILFITTEQFTNELVNSIQTRTTRDFRRRYRENDLLLVDDVHFLKGKEATQEEFFHTFNTLYEAGRQIILTSDRSPAEIPGLESRLVSRFQWGMVADIEHPDLEHRIAILQRKTEIDHLKDTIPDDVLEFIAESIQSNIRELEGSVIRLLAYASLRHQPISITLAREALREKITQHMEASNNNTGAKPSVTAIQQAVAHIWGISVDGLRSKSRTKQLTVPRQVAMLLIREELNLSLVEIGKAFGGRDHTTVIHSLDKVEADLAQDAELQKRLMEVRTLLRTLAA